MPDLPVHALRSAVIHQVIANAASSNRFWNDSDFAGDEPPPLD